MWNPTVNVREPAPLLYVYCLGVLRIYVTQRAGQEQFEGNGGMRGGLSMSSVLGLTFLLVVVLFIGCQDGRSIVKEGVEWEM